MVEFATALPVDGEWELEDLFVGPERMRQGVRSILAILERFDGTSAWL